MNAGSRLRAAWDGSRGGSAVRTKPVPAWTSACAQCVDCTVCTVCTHQPLISCVHHSTSHGMAVLISKDGATNADIPPKYPAIIQTDETID